MIPENEQTPETNGEAEENPNADRRSPGGRHPGAGGSLESVDALGDLIPEFPTDERPLYLHQGRITSAAARKWPKPRRTVRGRHIESAERKRRFLDLRLQGLSFAEIGIEMGVTAETASKVVRDGLREMPLEAADELRKVLIGRYEALTSRLWLLAMGGEIEFTNRAGRKVKELRLPDLNCVDRIVKMGHEVASLCGLIVQNPTADQAAQKSRSFSPLDPRVAEAMNIAGAKAMRDLGQLPGPQDEDPGPDDEPDDQEVRGEGAGGPPGS